MEKRAVRGDHAKNTVASRRRSIFLVSRLEEKILHAKRRRREREKPANRWRLRVDRADRAPKRFGRACTRTCAYAVRKVSVCPGHATFSPRTCTHACTHTCPGRAWHCVTVTTLSFYMTSRARPTNMPGDKGGRATDYHRSTPFRLEF